MLLLAKKVNLDKTVRNMAVWDRTDPSRGRKLMSTWQKGWTRLPLFFPHKLGQGRGTEEVILQLWRAFQSVTLRTFFKLNQIWVTPVTGACNIQGYSQCKAFLPPLSGWYLSVLTKGLGEFLQLVLTLGRPCLLLLPAVQHVLQLHLQCADQGLSVCTLGAQVAELLVNLSQLLLKFLSEISHKETIGMAEVIETFKTLV